MLRRGGGLRANTQYIQRVRGFAERLGAMGAQQLVCALAQSAVDAARHGQHGAAQPLGVADGVQRAAAGAGLGDAERLALRGNEPVAGQKSARRAPAVAGRILAADRAAALLNGGAQLRIGRGVGLVDGRAQKGNRRHISLHGGAVCLAVQSVGQAADEHDARPRHRQ